MSQLTRGQQIFAGRLAQRTGLNPQVLAAWMLQEESGSAARSRERAKNYNWLNIGWTDSGQRGTGNKRWMNPVTAADATAEWLTGKWSVPGFGRAAPGIQRIARTRGQPAATQIRAIQTSGWATSGEPLLPQLYRQVGGEVGAIKSAIKGRIGTTTIPGSTITTPTVSVPTMGGTTQATTFNEAGYKKAQGLSMLANLIAKRHGTNSPLFRLGVLSTQAPNPADFTATTETTTPGGAFKIPGTTFTTPATTVRTGTTGGATGARGHVTGQYVGELQHVTRTALQELAGLLGQPIQVGTVRTGHSYYTTTGNVSQHTTGNAADIPVPVDSAKGDSIAARALMLTGVPKAKAYAMARQGGLWNRQYKGRRMQIIWKTNVGGNHHNHVHIGY